MQLGLILKNARLVSNLKLKDVAKEVGTSIRFIQYIESNDRNPSLEVLYKLCKLYNLDKLPIN